MSSLDSRGRVELFIYKSLLQQRQSNVFNHWYVFFHGDIELQRVRSDGNLILWFSFRLLLKSRPYCSVEDRLPVAITNKNIICLSFPALENSVFLNLVLLSCTPVATNSFFCPSLRSSYTATLSSTRFWIFSTQWNSIGRRNRRWKAALEPGAWISLHSDSSRFQN